MTHRRPPSAHRGIVIVVVLVLLASCLTLFGIWARRVVIAERQVDSLHQRAQAIRLAEAGLRRALARRTADAQYQQETWSIPASDLDQKHAAKIGITIAAGASPNTLHYQATAEFPADEPRHAQVTRTLDVRNSNPDTQP